MAESNDFRPFKFRIQAFTNAFMDTVSTPIRSSRFSIADISSRQLSLHGMGEEVVAQKKVRNYTKLKQSCLAHFS